MSPFRFYYNKNVYFSPRFTNDNRIIENNISTELKYIFEEK